MTSDRTLGRVSWLPGAVLLLLGAAIGLLWGTAQAATVLSGTIRDAANQPVEGAEVLVYPSTNVKKPADYLSSKSGPDGTYAVSLPAGKYFVVAVQRKGGARFGPLQPGDRHSGEPAVVEIAAEAPARMDFVVMDLREAAKKVNKRSEQLFRVAGTIRDRDGRPVGMAFAVADRLRQTRDLPQFLSAWSGPDGTYVLYLPRGSFWIGGLTGFPAGAGYHLEKNLEIERDVDGIDLVLP